MPVRVRTSVELIDSEDGAVVVARMLDDPPNDGRVVAMSSENGAWASLVEVDAFADALKEFVAAQRIATCATCGQAFGPGDPLCGCGNADTGDLNLDEPF